MSPKFYVVCLSALHMHLSSRQVNEKRDLSAKCLEVGFFSIGEAVQQHGRSIKVLGDTLLLVIHCF